MLKCGRKKKIQTLELSSLVPPKHKGERAGGEALCSLRALNGNVCLNKMPNSLVPKLGRTPPARTGVTGLDPILGHPHCSGDHARWYRAQTQMTDYKPHLIDRGFVCLLRFRFVGGLVFFLIHAAFSQIAVTTTPAPIPTCPGSCCVPAALSPRLTGTLLPHATSSRHSCPSSSRCADAPGPSHLAITLTAAFLDIYYYYY